MRVVDTTQKQDRFRRAIGQGNEERLIGDKRVISGWAIRFGPCGNLGYRGRPGPFFIHKELSLLDDCLNKKRFAGTTQASIGVFVGSLTRPKKRIDWVA